ncbi:site-2 protease family protein [Clostridium lacusfryxellense]|uniref:site-2 protease family protein n=1 Tax=Clostridium lacusfryxellense TaxID=205328 RepID=UPI001C0A9F36|nr:site-2 protease family protein [Clostridium lacusfryxellense]MBU3111914.1 hypothetical protein [Clostridium lacusfryxellense]
MIKRKSAMNISQKNKHKLSPEIIIFLVFVVVTFVVGIIAGRSSNTYLEGFMNQHVKSDNMFLELLNFYMIFIIFGLGFVTHIVIHEAGHLIFGLMTGYSFVSFRIGSLTFIKENKKWKLKKFNIPGTAGQCLMMPPDLDDGNFPLVIYNLGGVIMNLITAIAAILIAIFAKGITYPIDAILVIFGAAGILIAITNGVPIRILRVPNDAYNVLSLLKSEDSRNAFYLQLKVNGLQSQGTRIKDMPLEIFKLKENVDLCNPLNTSIRLMEYTWYLDNMDFYRAKQCIDSFVPYIDKVVSIFKFEINCERIFLEITNNCDKTFIDDLYDKNLKKYIKAAKFMIGKKRLLMAYEGFYNKDKIKALKYYEETKQLAKSYPVKGEADMELMLVDWIKENLDDIIV